MKFLIKFLVKIPISSDYQIGEETYMGKSSICSNISPWAKFRDNATEYSSKEDAIRAIESWGCYISNYFKDYDFIVIK